MVEGLKLYSYWRSSAAYRVRIALNLKGLACELVPVHLLNDGGQQHRPAFRAVNPQQLIPVLVDGERVIRQSLAIIEYLDEAYDGEMKLLPTTARDRARVRGLAQIIACDVHPLGNLRVMQYLEREFGVAQEGRDQWSRHWIGAGLRVFEDLLAGNTSAGLYCEGDAPSLADICLVPQVYNARRFNIDLRGFPTIERIERQCLGLPQFDSARPENQPDAPRT